MKKVWSEETKIQLRAELMGKWGAEVGSDVARQRAESVETHMDNITRDWVMLRRSACLDHFKRGLGTETAYQARVDCFNRVLERQRAVLAQASDAGATAMDGLNQELNTCR